ncbi:type II secretion system F family protein [Agromyces mariniharenae]|uniref:Type II secretion system F family protein n=1 Tax=Agromyces mariniharenae TaxID=2604423 RepID=A0A5S4V9C6_9MICO|nr:type II secretion system F family protein [Agromyces mariniharenae]TYL53190.1 type II secretion system F family protein [Agromyces mariniharenae]
MPITTLLAYLAAGLVAIAAGAFVFLLLPWRRTEREPAIDSGAAPVPVQRSSFSESLVAAAPRGYIGWIERQVVVAGRPIGWSVSRILTWKIVLASVGLILGLLFIAAAPDAIRVLIVTASVLMLFFLPDVMIHSRAHDRQMSIKRSLPDTLDQMTIAVEAGLGFDAAMAKAARNGKGPLAEEFIRTLQDMSIGRTRRDAFMELERRTNSEDLRRFVRAIIQADAYGVAIGDVLRVQAGEMRLKRRQRAEEEAMKVTIKVLFPLIFCLLPVLFIIVLTPVVIRMVEMFG